MTVREKTAAPEKSGEGYVAVKDPLELVEEYNIFNLEGFIFDLSKRPRKEGHLVREELEFEQRLSAHEKSPVLIEPHPNYGRPAAG